MVGSGMRFSYGSILLALVLAVSLVGLSAHFLIVLLKGSQVLSGLRELTLLHALTNVPMHEGTLGIHEVELVVEAGEHLCHTRGIGNHAASALHLC